MFVACTFALKIKHIMTASNEYKDNNELSSLTFDENVGNLRVLS